MKSSGYYLVSLVLIFGLVLSACATPKAPASAPTPAPTPDRPAAPAAQLSREQRLIEGAKKEGEVVLWYSTGETADLARVLQDRYPFLRLKGWNNKQPEGLVKLAEEAKSGRVTADVFIGGVDVPSAYGQSLLSEYDYPNVVGWRAQPKHNFYKALALTGRVMVYNTNLVSPTEVPRSWDDMKSTRWAGRAFASNSGLEVPLLWAYLWREGDKLNWDKSFAFWEEVFRNTRPIDGGSYGIAVERVAAGEVALVNAAPTTSTMRLLAKGAPLGIAPVGVVVPGSGVGIGLVKNAPHPNAAQLLIDVLTSPEGLLAYADPTFFLVVDPKLEGKARANRTLRSLKVDYDLVPYELSTPENLKKSGDFWQKLLGLRR